MGKFSLKCNKTLSIDRSNIRLQFQLTGRVTGGRVTWEEEQDQLLANSGAWAECFRFLEVELSMSPSSGA